MRRLAVVLFVLAAGCRSSGGVKDAGVDAGADVGIDAAAPEPAAELPVDRPEPAMDAGRDVEIDAGIDAGVDVGPDVGLDLGVDVGVDTGVDRPPLTTLSFTDCVVSDVGSAVNMFAVSGASGAATDFDHDGKGDLVVGTWPDKHVITLKGKGDGTFQILSTKTVANEPRTVGFADLDGDGVDDVIAGAANATGLIVLRTDAAGRLADPVVYAGPAVWRFAAGDVDGDGRLDLVVGNANSTTSLPVYLGMAGGVLAPVKYVPSATAPQAPVLADFDGDGKLDVAVAASRINPSIVDGVVTMRGLGDATFDAFVPYPTRSFPIQNIAGDFTSDGHLDIVTFHSGTNQTTMLVGNADGTFQAARTLTTISTVSATWATADFDRDGRLDLATSEGNQFVVYPGKGDGTFAAGQYFHISLPGGAISVADLDGDGKMDAALAVASGAGSIGEVCAIRNTSR